MSDANANGPKVRKANREHAIIVAANAARLKREQQWNQLHRVATGMGMKARAQCVTASGAPSDKYGHVAAAELVEWLAANPSAVSAIRHKMPKEHNLGRFIRRWVDRYFELAKPANAAAPRCRPHHRPQPVGGRSRQPHPAAGLQR
jgi:hypothetical protein